MRNPTPLRRGIHATTLVAGGIAAMLTLAACHGSARPQSAPTGSSTSSTTPPPAAPTTAPIFSGVPQDATAVGTLDVLLALTTPESHLPESPVSYSLLVHPSTDSVATEYPVDPDGTFALPLAPGTYLVDVLELWADDLGPDSVLLPLTTSRQLRLRVPASGCAYGGKVSITYGRLPAGSQAQQQVIVERASRTNHASYSFVYRPDGGFVMAGAAITMPAQDQRPTAARSCAPDAFTFVRAG